MKKNCERCGTEFEPKHPSRKYCSSTCKQYAYFERNGMSFGNTVNPVKDTEKEKVAEDTRATEENVVETQTSEAVNPVNETGVKKESPSITPVTQEKNSVIPKKKEKPEIKSTPSIQEKQTVNITLEQLERILKKVANPQPEPQKEKQKSFPDKLSERANNGSSANIFTRENFPNWYYSQWENIKYVNERMKSHFKKLTELTKRTVDISVIKYITKQINDLVGTVYFEYLPVDYPFTNFIKELAKRMIEYVKYLEKEEIEKVKIKINEEKYMEMKAIIAQIGTTVPDVNHSIPPEENKKRARGD